MSKYEVLLQYRNIGDQGVLYKYARVMVEAAGEAEAREKSIDEAYKKHPEGEHFTPCNVMKIWSSP